jgi:hypothetical protein
MTKEQFIELIKGKLTGGNSNPDLSEKYHEGRIELFIGLAFNDVIYQVFARNLDDKDLYVRAFTADVILDEQFDQYYAVLPAKVIQLPNNSGIHKVSPVKENWSFVPINQLSEEIFSELEVHNACKEPSYYFSAEKIFFQYYDWKNKHLKKVRLDIIIPFEEYADTDTVVVPAGKESAIIDNVFKMMSEQLPVDHTNNLNDTQV